MSLALNDLPPTSDAVTSDPVASVPVFVPGALSKRPPLARSVIVWTLHRLPRIALNLLLLLLVIGLIVLTWCPVWFGASGR